MLMDRKAFVAIRRSAIYAASVCSNLGLNFNQENIKINLKYLKFGFFSIPLRVIWVDQEWTLEQYSE